MKKIIDFFKSLFTNLEYVPTEYNVTVDEQPQVKQVKKKTTKKPATKKAVKKTETKKTTKKK